MNETFYKTTFTFTLLNKLKISSRQLYVESSSDHVSCAKFGKIHASNSILNSISRVTSLKRMYALTIPQIQRVTFSYRTPCVVTKVRFSSVIFFDLKEASLATVVPIPWSAPEQPVPPPPIMITEPLQPLLHQKPTSSAPCRSPLHEAFPKPSVVRYCPPYLTLHFPRHSPLDQTEPFLKLP